MKPVTWIDRAEALEAAVARWLAAPEVALDTEFVFERTFRARLGLVQVAAGGEIALVDAVAIPGPGALRALFEAPGARKLLHAGAGDVEVLSRATGAVPRPLLDTQIAAAFAGLGPALSYAALVETLTGVVLAKHETRTDWLRRPLAPEQLRYAAEDVEHLPAVAAELERRLVALGRLEWALEDSQAMAASGAEGGAGEEESVLRRLRSLDRLPPRARRVARALVLWREREAERLDLARPFLLRDETLVALARRPDVTVTELAKLPGYDRRRHAAHAARWLEALAAARDEAERDGAPPEPAFERPRVPLERLKRVGHALAETVARRAAELGLPPELLLSRRQRDRLLRAWNGSAPVSAPLTGFRRALLGADLDSSVAD
ncbi:MAG: ribonuclease D [Thermoanaerobaculia bacterium]|nr:MAG: ribonuclease D [Thermoanaerobaculia bacterium]